MRPALALSLAVVLLGALPAEAGNRISRAAVDGDLELIKKRVKLGEDVNDVDTWGWSALTWAVYYDQRDVAKWLLENGANPNFKTTQTYGRFWPGATPLTLAGYYGYAEIMQELLKYKADTMARDHDGKTALDYAKAFGFKACEDMLRSAAPPSAAPAADAQSGK